MRRRARPVHERSGSSRRAAARRAAHRAALRGRASVLARRTRADRLSSPTAARRPASSSSSRPGRSPATAAGRRERRGLAGRSRGALVAERDARRPRLRRTRRSAARTSTSGRTGGSAPAARARSSTARSSSTHVGDLARLRRAVPAAARLARRRAARRAGHRPWRAASRTASGLDGSAERLVERRRCVCYVARGAAAAGSRRSRASTAARARSTRSRTAACGAVPQRRALVPPVSCASRSAHASGTATGHEIEALGRSAARRGARGPRAADPRRAALAHGPMPWLEMVALADAGFHVLFGEPARLGRLRRGVRERRSTGAGARLDSPTCSASSTGRSPGPRRARSRRPARPLLRRLHGALAARAPSRAASRPPSARTRSWTSSPSTARPTPGVDIGRRRGGQSTAVGRRRAHARRSPAAQIHRNAAPLLLLQAEGDLRCPPVNSEIAFAILRGSAGRRDGALPGRVPPAPRGRPARPARRPPRADRRLVRASTCTATRPRAIRAGRRPARAARARPGRCPRRSRLRRAGRREMWRPWICRHRLLARSRALVSRAARRAPRSPRRAVPSSSVSPSGKRARSIRSIDGKNAFSQNPPKCDGSNVADHRRGP